MRGDAALGVSCRSPLGLNATSGRIDHASRRPIPRRRWRRARSCLFSSTSSARLAERLDAFKTEPPMARLQISEPGQSPNPPTRRIAVEPTSAPRTPWSRPCPCRGRSLPLPRARASCRRRRPTSMRAPPIGVDALAAQARPSEHGVLVKRMMGTARCPTCPGNPSCPIAFIDNPGWWPSNPEGSRRRSKFRPKPRCPRQRA